MERKYDYAWGKKGVRPILIQTLFLSLSAFIMSGCGESTSQTELTNSTEIIQGVQTIDTDTVLTKSTTSVIHTEIVLDSALKKVPINYYLVSDEADKAVTGDVEDNSTTNIIPKEQYSVGTVISDIESGVSYLDTNITIGNNVPVGTYRLAAHINPLNKSAYKNGDIYISNDTIEVLASKVDIELESLSLDEDIFIVDDLENDTLLLSTLRAKSTTGKVENINVQACLEFNSKCIPLEFMVEGNISSSKEILSLDEVMTNVSTTFFISKELKRELYSQLDENINDAYVKVTLSSTEDEVTLENNTGKTRISLYKFHAQSPSRAASKNSQVVFKNFSKGFDASKNDSRFGITFNSGAGGNFGSIYSDAGVNGLLAVKILGAGFTLLDVDLGVTVQYDSFADTGYSVLIKSLDVNVFSNENNLVDMIGSTTPDTATLDDNETGLPQDEKDKILAARQADKNAAVSSRLAYTKDFSYEKEISKEQTIMVGIVPVVVKAGAIGTLGFDGTIGLNGILLLSSNMGPTANLAGFASGGIGITGFSAGIQASFTFIENDFRGISEFEFLFSGDSIDLRLKGILSEQVVNTFGGPNGSVDLYAEYTQPKICQSSRTICTRYKWKKGRLKCKSRKRFTAYYPCGITTNRPTLNIFKWDSGVSRDITLLDESQTLLDIKLY